MRKKLRHHQLPKLLIVDVSSADKFLCELESYNVCEVPRSVVYDYAVDYLNRPVQYNAVLVSTVEFLIANALIFNHSTDTPLIADDYLDLAREKISNFLLACDRLFRDNGLYIDQRLNYAYKKHHRAARVILAKRECPIY